MPFSELFTDFVCAHKGDLEIGYMTELDPLWNDDQLSIILNAEAALFWQSPCPNSLYCRLCGSSLGKPQDSLFWCAGCQGSLYPFTGTVADHVGAIQASSLFVHRMLAKLHRSFMLKGFEKDEFCEAQYLPIIKKASTKHNSSIPFPKPKVNAIPWAKQT